MYSDDNLYYLIGMLAGSSIQACRATHRHILAFEEDKDIFDALIAPAMRTAKVVRHPPPPPALDLVDLDEEDVPAQPIVKTSRFSK